MLIYLDESGDLGWSLDKPHRRGGSSRFITIAGLAIETKRQKFLGSFVNDIYRKNHFPFNAEYKGSQIPNERAISIIQDLGSIFSGSPVSKIVAITAYKENVGKPLRRDANVFYNFLLNNLLIEIMEENRQVDIVLDNRTIRIGSQNSFEDCMKTKCWGELGLDINISCRYHESNHNRGLWLADWLSNFIWRHYERHMSDPYLQCANSSHFHERILFM